jgi:prepilin-type N-terminal cleavage/methylation domain-containing protein
MKHNKGFTLVELSIVLVIIGLIVGGIVGGQSLIKSARLNKVTTEVGSFKTAFRAFELQYDALPGDMTEAYDYWGVAAGCTDANVNSISTRDGCNGNGDNQVSNIEGFRAWQHLALAKIIPGSYTGRLTGSYSASIAEMEATRPKSASDGFYRIVVSVEASSGSLTGTGAHAIMLGGPVYYSAFSSYFNTGALLTPSEARSIDKKLDDGVANTGSTLASIAYPFTTTDCVTANYGTDYNLDSPEKACNLYFNIK